MDKITKALENLVNAIEMNTEFMFYDQQDATISYKNIEDEHNEAIDALKEAGVFDE